VSLWRGRDRGQAAVEMAIIMIALITATAGLLDVGRGMYQNNALASAARFGSRWASVVGGTCSSRVGTSTSDWCTQLGQTTSTFWSQPGNLPSQANNTSCPTDLSSAASPSPYYALSSYVSTTSTTIVGEIAQRFDSNNTGTNLVKSAVNPGFDLSKVKVCIQLGWDSINSVWATKPGDRVTVYVYYPFSPVTPLISNLASVTLVASSQYEIE
jgi:Flp pilus assembly protein TadG